MVRGWLVFIRKTLNLFADEYTVEYLEPEYVNKFVTEIAQNDDEDDENEELELNSDQDQEQDTSADPSKSENSQTKGRKKRTYPYKCTKCNKRFVYKEVFEAHNRVHKGLPGFS